MEAWHSVGLFGVYYCSLSECISRGVGFVCLAARGGGILFLKSSHRSALVPWSRKHQESVVLTFQHTFRKNRGSQQGTLVDVFARPWLPCEQFSAAELDDESDHCFKAARNDGYWEAALFPYGQGRQGCCHCEV